MSSDQFSSNRVIYYNTVTYWPATTQHTDFSIIMETVLPSSDRGLIYQGANFNVDILYSLLPFILFLGKNTIENQLMNFTTLHFSRTLSCSIFGDDLDKCNFRLHIRVSTVVPSPLLEMKFSKNIFLLFPVK